MKVFSRRFFFLIYIISLCRRLRIQNIYFPQGVPLRIELGPRDIDNQQMVVVRRDTGEKVLC